MTELKDSYLLNCPEYGDYLDLFIEKEDFQYMQNIEFLRKLVALGFRSSTPIMTPEQFEFRKNMVHEVLYPTKKSAVQFSGGLQIRDQFLAELQAREPPNNAKYLSTIIFLCYKTKAGAEISGYIDYEQSLREANKSIENAIPWKLIFKMKKTLKPRQNDLSYYNWKTNKVQYNHSENYQVMHHPKLGLCFMYKGDRKMICVDPLYDEYTDNVTRTVVTSDKYGYVVLYDHLIRRKI